MAEATLTKEERAAIDALLKGSPEPTKETSTTTPSETPQAGLSQAELDAINAIRPTPQQTTSPPTREERNAEPQINLNNPTTEFVEPPELKLKAASDEIGILDQTNTLRTGKADRPYMESLTQDNWENLKDLDSIGRPLVGKKNSTFGIKPSIFNFGNDGLQVPEWSRAIAEQDNFERQVLFSYGNSTLQDALHGSLIDNFGEFIRDPDFEEPKAKELFTTFSDEDLDFMAEVMFSREHMDEYTDTQKDAMAHEVAVRSYFNEVIAKLSPAELKAFFVTENVTDLFGARSFFSDDHRVRVDATARYVASLPWHNQIPLHIAATVPRAFLEFEALPVSFLGKLKALKNSPKLLAVVGASVQFAAHTALQAPAPEETLRERAISVLYQGGTGGVVGAVGTLPFKELTKLGITAGGFGAITALQGGGVKEVTESIATILAFHALGMMKGGKKPTKEMRDRLRAAAAEQGRPITLNDKALNKAIIEVSKTQAPSPDAQQAALASHATKAKGKPAKKTAPIKQPKAPEPDKKLNPAQAALQKANTTRGQLKAQEAEALKQTSHALNENFVNKDLEGLKDLEARISLAVKQGATNSPQLNTLKEKAKRMRGMVELDNLETMSYKRKQELAREFGMPSFVKNEKLTADLAKINRRRKGPEAQIKKDIRGLTKVRKSLGLTPFKRPGPLKRTASEKKSLTNIHQLEKDMKLSDNAYRSAIEGITGKTSTTELNAIELKAVEAHFEAIKTDVVIKNGAKKLGLTDAEFKAAEGMAAGRQQKQILNTVFNDYYKDFVISKDPFTAGKQKADMAAMITGMAKHDKAIQKEVDFGLGLFGRIMSRTRDWKMTIQSMRYFYSDMDMKTGQRFWDSHNDMITQKNVGVDQSHRAREKVMAKHGFTSTKEFIMSRKTARLIGRMLNTPRGSEEYNAMRAQLTPKQKRMADTAGDIFNINPKDPVNTGHSEKMVREVRYYQWDSIAKKAESAIRKELAKPKPKQSVIKAERKKIMDALPPSGSHPNKKERLKMMQRLRAAENKGRAEFDAAIIQNDIGSLKAFFPSDTKWNNFVEEIVGSNGALDPRLATTTAGKTVEVKIKNKATLSRRGAEVDLVQINPLQAARVHSDRLSIMARTYRPIESFWGKVKNTNLTINEGNAIYENMLNVTGAIRKINPLATGFSFIKHRFWQVKGWTAPFMAKFIARNIGQNGFAAAQVEAKKLPGWAGRAFRTIKNGEKLNPWLVEDMAKNEFITVKNRNQIYDQMSLTNGTKNGATVWSEWNNFMDLGSKGMAWSDGKNRTITYATMHQGAYETMRAQVTGKITRSQMYKTLGLDLFPRPIREAWEQLYDAKRYRSAANFFAKEKTANIHYLYDISSKAVLDQNPATNVLTGPWNWPRSFFENYRQSVRTLSDGVTDNDPQKKFEGAKGVAKLMLATYALNRSYAAFTGDDGYYGMVDSILPSLGNSPELSWVQVTTETFKRLTQAATIDDPKQRNRAVTQTFEWAMEVGGMAVAPIVLGIAETMATSAEIVTDRGHLKRFEGAYVLLKHLSGERPRKSQLNPKATTRERRTGRDIIARGLGNRFQSEKQRRADRQQERDKGETVRQLEKIGVIPQRFQRK